MSVGKIMVIVGIAGLAIVLVAIPVAMLLLRRRERAIAQSVREEYEL